MSKKAKIIILPLTFLLGMIVASLFHSYFAGEQQADNIKLDAFVLYDLLETNGLKAAYHASSPMYGIPIIEYVTIMELLEKGDVQRTKQRLESFLDCAAIDAQSRILHPDTTPTAKEQIKQSLMKLVKWREVYPRQLPNESSNNIFLNMERLKELDEFLSKLEGSRKG